MCRCIHLQILLLVNHGLLVLFVYQTAHKLGLIDAKDKVHVLLTASKTKIASLRCLTIPGLELCDAHLLSKLFHHVQEVHFILLHDIYGWTDSSICIELDKWKSSMIQNLCWQSHFMYHRAASSWMLETHQRHRISCRLSSRGIFPIELVRFVNNCKKRGQASHGWVILDLFSAARSFPKWDTRSCSTGDCKLYHQFSTHTLYPCW